MSQKITVVSPQALWEQANQAIAAGRPSVEVDAELLRAVSEHLHQELQRVAYLEGLIIRMGRS
ncbi:hypothetical protein CBR67_03795 [Bordetella hinzii]|uniref:hypothetical protein n=1 Tax=Bordetella hinzii TaxID=103855 RepID=UPI00114EABC6|nr:hypothetical protein [Bordetella hinzii]QDJ35843.1 hypothetical protein CBR67_03795 [Bordetella hinzii]